MSNEIIDFQYFLMSVILLSNTNYIYFALRDIKENNKNNQVLIYKCIIFSLYTMFFSILHVFLFIKEDGNYYFIGDTYTILVIACALFLTVTLVVYGIVKKKSNVKVKMIEWNHVVSFGLVLSYALGIMNNYVLYAAVFLGYTWVALQFFYTVFILKRVITNYGFYFLLSSYCVIAFATILYSFLPFEILETVILALNVLSMFGLFLFYAQYYVEELNVTYESVVAHSVNLERLNSEMKSMAFHDTLTGLPNEVSFIKFIENNKENLTLMMINVRNFASFNQILGFNQGNVLLKKMSEQLMSFSEDKNSLFKLYNDKFLIVTTQKDQREVIQYVKRIQEAFVHEAVMNFRMEIGVGITHLDTKFVDADIANTVIGALEVANSKAKSTENGLYYLSVERYLLEKAQYNLEYHLKHAIEHKQIEVYYQPQVDSKTKRVNSYEALARWCLEGQFVSPAVFIPLAESTGLISKLSYNVIETVFSSIYSLKWNQGRKVSINLSSIQLVESDFLTILKALLNRYSINAHEIVFEITETALLYDLKKVEETIRTIKTLGFEISLDDFGTGYSSLNRFAKLNFDEVKFDRFFINDLQNDEKLMLVFSKTVELFNLFKMRIVVEGIENDMQESILDAFEIDIYQGFYYSKPMPLEQLLTENIVKAVCDSTV